VQIKLAKRIREPADSLSFLFKFELHEKFMNMGGTHAVLTIFDFIGPRKIWNLEGKRDIS
jgi:hypothetical protein